MDPVFYVVKSGYDTKNILQIQHIPLQISTKLLTEHIKGQYSTTQAIKEKNIRLNKIILKNKRSSRGITSTISKLYFRVIKIKVTWYQHKNRHVDQRHWLADPYINIHTYGHLIFIKEWEIQWKNVSMFSRCCWSNWMTACTRM